MLTSQPITIVLWHTSANRPGPQIMAMATICNIKPRIYIHSTLGWPFAPKAIMAVAPSTPENSTLFAQTCFMGRSV